MQFSNLAWTGSTPSVSEFKLTSGSSVTIGYLANDNAPNSNDDLSYNISTTATVSIFT